MEPSLPPNSRPLSLWFIFQPSFYISCILVWEGPTQCASFCHASSEPFKKSDKSISWYKPKDYLFSPIKQTLKSVAYICSQIGFQQWVQTWNCPFNCAGPSQVSFLWEQIGDGHEQGQWHTDHERREVCPTQKLFPTPGFISSQDDWWREIPFLSRNLLISSRLTNLLACNWS